jgi:hypothetical protein
MAAFQIRLHSLDFGEHLNPGRYRAKRGTLGILRAEQGHQSIAHVIIHVAFMTMNDRAHAVEVSVQRVNHV